MKTGATDAPEQLSFDPLARVRALHGAGVLGDVDLAFAEALSRLGGEHDERVALAAALTSRQLQASHVCLDLPALCEGTLALELPAETQLPAWPALDGWRAALAQSALVGGPDAYTPLYLDARGRLYLRRYFEHERALAADLLARASAALPLLDAGVLEAGLARLFPAHATHVEPDLQREAARHALQRALCVISGGPGTGKTSTVVKILALLVEQAHALRAAAPKVLLLAPTGKAAARLSEAIKQARLSLACAPEVIDAIPAQASTIHRALGVRRRGRGRARTPAALRNAEVLVVDEASMVDLALMATLLGQTPRSARVILLGDENQLASVEAGAVLGDICGSGLRDAARAARSPITPCVVRLTHSYRYRPESGIRRLADAINAGDADAALALLADAAANDVALVSPRDPKSGLRRLLRAAAERFAPLFEAQSAADKLRLLERFRVLCALRRGPYGQLAINTGIEAELRAAGTLRGAFGRYPSRPILITQNDYQARLFNGDIGVFAGGTADEGQLQACFLAADGQLRQIAAARLPPHESAYAMSVHKSQGSELDEVAVVLPREPSPVLCRELLYTAVTRARKSVTLYASPEVLRHAIGRSIERASGLEDALFR